MSYTLKADGYWATLIIYDEDGKEIKTLKCESVLPLLHYVEKMTLTNK